jgi:hypothetical protein
LLVPLFPKIADWEAYGKHEAVRRYSLTGSLLELEYRREIALQEIARETVLLRLCLT